jgi:hypothetical protein
LDSDGGNVAPAHGKMLNPLKNESSAFRMLSHKSALKRRGFRPCQVSLNYPNGCLSTCKRSASARMSECLRPMICTVTVSGIYYRHRWCNGGYYVNDRDSFRSADHTPEPCWWQSAGPEWILLTNPDLSAHAIDQLLRVVADPALKHCLHVLDLVNAF